MGTSVAVFVIALVIAFEIAIFWLAGEVASYFGHPAWIGWALLFLVNVAVGVLRGGGSK